MATARGAGRADCIGLDIWSVMLSRAEIYLDLGLHLPV